jgi:hypothetical protein
MIILISKKVSNLVSSVSAPNMFLLKTNSFSPLAAFARSGCKRFHTHAAVVTAFSCTQRLRPLAHAHSGCDRFYTRTQRLLPLTHARSAAFTHARSGRCRLHTHTAVVTAHTRTQRLLPLSHTAYTRTQRLLPLSLARNRFTAHLK